MQQNISSVSSSGLTSQIHQGISEVTARSHSRDKVPSIFVMSVPPSVSLCRHVSARLPLDIFT